MKRNLRNKGFTLIELLVVISIIALLAAGAYAGYGKLMPGIRAKAAASTGHTIHTLLNAYALDNDQRFPQCEMSSNEAFRQLFTSKLIDDENIFAIANDAWHDNAPGGLKKPDGDRGIAPDYTQALQAGECAWAYVTGLDTASTTTLPIMANAFSEQVGKYSLNKNKKGGVFQGQKAVWVNVGGSAKVADLDDKVLEIQEQKGGRKVNVFSSDYETVTDDVKNPEG